MAPFCRGWSWKDQSSLFSGKRKRTGLNLQVPVSLTGRLRWASDPLPGPTHDAKAITTSGLPEEINPSQRIADKDYIGTGITASTRTLPQGELTEPQK
ncbi:transposase family protein [Actinomyces bowdenii]|uniref:transposase family protein n=1 Tax=Actinomyces bowdenii TaxID=131109 RepID=UPI001FD2FB12|nr:transposase family protein [Actinomyces bowdenii]